MSRAPWAMPKPSAAFPRGNVTAYDKRFCAAASSLEITGQNFTDTQTRQSCDTIIASASNVQVPGDVTLVAGSQVILGPDFTVGANGVLTIRIDPALLP